MSLEFDGPAPGDAGLASATTTWIRVAAAALAAWIVALLRLAPVARADAGAYLSVERLLLRGYSLYSEVFDNKDPLFYVVNAGLMWIGGPKAPFVGETMCLAIAGGVASWFIQHRGGNPVASIAVGPLIAVLLTPSSEFGLLSAGLTHTWGMCAALVAIMLALGERLGAAAAIAVVAALLELRTGAVAVAGLGVAIAFTGGRRSQLIRCARGAATAVLVAVLLLGLVGGFNSYPALISYNVGHLADARMWLDRSVDGRLAEAREGLHHARVTVPSTFWIAIVVTVAALVWFGVIMWRMHARDDGVDEPRLDLDRLDAAVLGAVALATLVATALTSLFTHHYQLLGLVPALGFVLGLARIPQRRVAVVEVAVVISVVGVAIILGRGWPSPRDQAERWWAPLRSPAAEALEHAVPDGRFSYSIAGDNEAESAHAAFLDGRFEFTCRLIYQHPWDRRFFDDYLNCLATEPDVVLASSYDEQLQDVFPTYSKLRRDIDAVLAECFRQVEVPEVDSTYRVFERVDDCDSRTSPVEA